MPGTILSSIFGRPSMSITNEATQAALWTALGVVDVEIIIASENSDKPLSNQQISDEKAYQSILSADIGTVKIISPTRLRITALCADLSTIKSIISTFDDPTATMSINTKSVITRFLAMSEVDIEQNADMISASRVVMVFEQSQPVESSGFNPEQAADQSVYGISLATPPSVVPLATLTKAIASATSVIPPIVSGALIDSLGGPFILDFSKLS
jgi:hypothetical protein